MLKEKENIIIYYELNDDKIILHYFDKFNDTIPYTIWNERKIINKIKKQIKENRKKCKCIITESIFWAFTNIFAIFFNSYIVFNTFLEQNAILTIELFTTIYAVILFDKLNKIHKNFKILKVENKVLLFVNTKEHEFENKQKKELEKKDKHLNNIEQLNKFKSTLINDSIKYVSNDMLMNDLEEDKYIKKLTKKIK